MNTQVIRLFGLVTLLFAVLVGFTSRWSVFEAEALRDQDENKRVLLEQQQIRRGTVFAADGTVIARSVRRGRGNARIYLRRYPQGALFGHPIGYSFTELGQSEFEQFHDDELIGAEAEFASLLDELRGHRQEGDNIVSTLFPSAQQTAFEALGGQPGAVIAIEPQTGKVRAMISQPPYDPTDVPGHFAQLNRDESAPLLNRATQSGYPPGSTMKVVTATAALDSGKFTPSSVVNGDTGIPIDGVPLANSGGASFGPIDLTTALTNSVNTVWAQVAEAVGTETYYDYMDRYGFGEDPAIDLPDDELAPSGVYAEGRVIPESAPVDIGRVGIGQERLFVTPLQMATVVATVANGGERPRLTLWDRVVDPDGRVVKRFDPRTEEEVMSPETAATLNEMMQSVVNEGTGTAAALSGIDVAGKTGTAEVPGREACAGLPNQAWFIGFAPANDPQVAVAATIECTTGQGGTVAAPIAKAVMESVLAAQGNG
ncbi:MAG TPA: penicillin-binding transpeptidase domain-containing protein [Solirubrobacterales bacterium]|nr:penicillin-binding transpeptidase domain-containing protein [Solirubrobacterales bacterium]